MEDFFIIRRIGINDTHYILDVLYFPSHRTKLRLYNIKTDSFETTEITKDIYESFFDFYRTKPIYLKYSERPSEKALNLEQYCTFRFDKSSDPKLKTMQYTIKDTITGALFSPCSGRHENHEEIMKWGNYINTFNLDGVLCDGYQIFDHNLYDRFILKINPSEYDVDLTDISNFLIRELGEYLKDLLIGTSDEFSIKIEYKSGRVINVKL
jgi:hypothetical protein